MFSFWKRNASRESRASADVRRQHDACNASHCSERRSGGSGPPISAKTPAKSGRDSCTHNSSCPSSDTRKWNIGVAELFASIDPDVLYSRLTLCNPFPPPLPPHSRAVFAGSGQILGRWFVWKRGRTGESCAPNPRHPGTNNQLFWVLACRLVSCPLIHYPPIYMCIYIYLYIHVYILIYIYIYMYTYVY